MAEKNTPNTPNAEAQAKLKELATDRVKRACQAISSVGNLGEFKPTATQTTAMVTAMRNAIDAAEKQLKNPEVSASGFALPD